MDIGTVSAIIASVSALLVALFTQMRQSRCTEIDCCGDCVVLKRDVLKSENSV